MPMPTYDRAHLYCPLLFVCDVPSISSGLTNHTLMTRTMDSSCLFSSRLLILWCFFCIIVVAVVAGEAPDFDINDMMNQNCPNYRCSAGMTPTPKARPKFESTGCSTLGAGSIMMTGGGGSTDKPYEACCDLWHACYQVCGVSKKSCDQQFETCAKDRCHSATDSETCTKDADLSIMMMKLGGCQAFNQAQYKACDCTATKDKAVAQREAALRYFYKKQAPDNVDKVPNLVAKADTPSKLAGLFVKLLAKYPAAIGNVRQDSSRNGTTEKRQGYSRYARRRRRGCGRRAY